MVCSAPTTSRPIHHRGGPCDGRRGRREAVDVAHERTCAPKLSRQTAGVALRHHHRARGRGRPRSSRRPSDLGSLTPPELASTPGDPPAQRRHQPLLSSPFGRATHPSNSSPPRPDSSTVPRTGCARSRPRDRRRAPGRRDPSTGHRLSDEQAPRSPSVAVSGRQVDLLVGPAGAGKTTAMRALPAGPGRGHGPGSVDRARTVRRCRRRCLPTISASPATTPPSGSTSTTTAVPTSRGPARHHRRSHPRRHVHPGPHHRPCRSSRREGPAGGRLGAAPVRRRRRSVRAARRSRVTDAPELADIHRFRNEWEKAASLDLRDGRAEVIGTYVRHDRVREGDTARHARRRLRCLACRHSSRGAAACWSPTPSSRRAQRRARAERIVDGDTRRRAAGPPRRRHAGLGRRPRHHPPQRPAPPRDARRLGPQRRPLAHRRRPRRWLGRRPAPRQQFGGTVVLPAGYVAEHVDLGYAVTATAPRASPSTPRTSSSPHDHPREPLRLHDPRPRIQHRLRRARCPRRQPRGTVTREVTAKTVLFGVLQRSGIELSAHQTIKAEQEHWSSFAQPRGRVPHNRRGSPTRPVDRSTPGGRGDRGAS